MAGIHLIDIIVILVYLALMVFIGLWSSRSVKNTGDFFIGGRRFGKFMTIMFNFGTGTHSDQAVGVISKCYSVGLAGIWYQWLWLMVTPFYWIIAPILRRLRVVTTADYFKVRYNQSVATLYAIMAIIILMLNMGTMLLGSGRIIEAISDGKISFSVAVFGMTALFLVYGIAGGLVAAILTDFIQGILTIFLSFILLPFAIIRVGGFSGLHDKLSGGASNLFSFIAPGDITVFFIFVTAVNAIIGWALQPQSILMAAACKTEMESRVGVCYGNFIKRFCTVSWAFIGLCCIALFPALEIGQASLVPFLDRFLFNIWLERPCQCFRHCPFFHFRYLAIRPLEHRRGGSTDLHVLIQIAPELLQLPVHPFFLVLGRPVICYIPRTFGNQYHDLARPSAACPAPALDGPYLRRHRFVEHHKVRGRYVQSFFSHRGGDQHVLFPTSEHVQ